MSSADTEMPVSLESALAAMNKQVISLSREEFIHTLLHFMQKRGTPLILDKLPIIGKRSLDLYKLFKLVTERGGFNVVSVVFFCSIHLNFFLNQGNTRKELG